MRTALTLAPVLLLASLGACNSVDRPKGSPPTEPPRVQTRRDIPSETAGSAAGKTPRHEQAGQVPHARQGDCDHGNPSYNREEGSWGGNCPPTNTAHDPNVRDATPAGQGGS